MTKYEFWSLVIQSLSVVAAILVVIVAIWGSYLKALFASPKLLISLFSSEGEPTTLSDGSKARYYHVVVKNERSWAEAKNVIVYIYSLERLGPDGEWQQAMYSGQVPLMWQFGEFDYGLPNIGKERLCDLGRVLEGLNFELRTKFVPNNFNPCVKANQSMRVYIQAVADNGKSNNLVLQISWDGVWVQGESEMRKHLIIKEVQESIGSEAEASPHNQTSHCWLTCYSVYGVRPYI